MQVSKNKNLTLPDLSFDQTLHCTTPCKRLHVQHCEWPAESGIDGCMATVNFNFARVHYKIGLHESIASLIRCTKIMGKKEVVQQQKSRLSETIHLWVAVKFHEKPGLLAINQ